MREFTKVLVALILAPFFIAVIVGVYVVLKMDASQYATLCMLVGTPATAAVGFYCWKAKAENIQKIAASSTKAALEKVKNAAEAIGGV